MCQTKINYLEINKLFVYPIKSLKGISGESALVTDSGFQIASTSLISMADTKFRIQAKCHRTKKTRSYHQKLFNRCKAKKSKVVLCFLI
ncbi:MAG: MOSC N-terminal beta barrel domain-containing protein [Saprospiraceae bacterium]|nr:MOSC N-terminal beta barrel domain-containing protein [Saprospiraceae bacterium]